MHQTLSVSRTVGLAFTSRNELQARPRLLIVITIISSSGEPQRSDLLQPVSRGTPNQETSANQRTTTYHEICSFLVVRKTTSILNPSIWILFSLVTHSDLQHLELHSTRVDPCPVLLCTWSLGTNTRYSLCHPTPPGTQLGFLGRDTGSWPVSLDTRACRRRSRSRTQSSSVHRARCG
ncbi:unnamed protein product [Arctogadus glacialis]